MTKKFLAVFLTISMVLSFSACGGEKNNDDLSTAEVTTATSEATSELTTTTTSQTTAEVTTERVLKITFKITDWTMEDFVNDLELCGNKITFPCTVNDFGKDFFTSNMPIYLRGDDLTSGDLNYKNNRLGSVFVKGKTKDITDEKIVLMVLSNWDTDIQFNFMGVTQDSTPEDIIKALGKPNVENEKGSETSYRYYFTENKHILFSYMGEDKIDFVSIYYNVEE